MQNENIENLQAELKNAQAAFGESTAQAEILAAQMQQLQALRQQQFEAVQKIKNAIESEKTGTGA